MRYLKVAGYALGGLIVLVALLLLYVVAFVNPDDYKARIADAVKASTGRELILQGDIKLSVFPWLALQLGPASLGNPAGFGPEPFLTLQHAALRVKLLPLLRKQLQIGRIEIDTLDLRLKKNSAGKGNWENFGQESAPDVRSGTNPPTASLQNLGGIIVKDSHVSYGEFSASHLNLDVGKVAPRKPAPVRLSFDFGTGPGGSQSSVAATLSMTPDWQSQTCDLQAVTASGELQRPNGGKSLPWKFTAPAINADLTAQSLKAGAFSAELAAAQLSGSLSGQKIIDAPQFSGALQLAPLSLRDWLPRLGIKLPPTRDDTAFSRLAASSNYSYAANTLRLSALDLKLDATQMRGELRFTDSDTLAIHFNLNADRIDLDGYLAPASTAQKASEDKPTVLPTTSLRSLDADGSLGIGDAKVAGMTLTQLQAGVRAQNGLLTLAPIKASLYGGAYLGTITYDARGSIARVRMEQRLTGVDIERLLQDSVKVKRLSGRGNVTAKLAGSGRTGGALLRNLSGRVEANLTNGAVNGIDLWHEINQAQALLKQHALPTTTSDRRTRFDVCKVSADISDGVATTRDLLLSSAYLRVTGTGTTNLITKAIDYSIVAKILKTPPSSDSTELTSLTLVDIPVTVRGTMDDPKVRPDVAGLLKSRVKQKLEDTLQDKLKGLLGR